jgi:hypothetical protein
VIPKEKTLRDSGLLGKSARKGASLTHSQGSKLAESLKAQMEESIRKKKESKEKLKTEKPEEKTEIRVRLL